MDYTENQRQSARAELARRELAKRGQSLESSPEMEEPDLSTHPLRDIMIGLTHAGRNLHNLPHDQVKSLEDIFSKLGSNFEGIVGPKFSEQRKEHKKISDYLPYDARDFGDIYGQKGEGNLLDKIIQGGVEHAPELATIYQIGKHLPLTKFPATKALNEVKKQIGERNIKNLKVPEHILKDIVENKFMRNTQPNRNLLEKAKEGGYEDLFNLQSDLGQIERSHTRDPFSASNRQFGRDVGATRQELLSSMKDELGNLGHEDLAKFLSHGQNLYIKYMKVRPYRNAALSLGLTAIPGYKYGKKLIP